MPSESIAQRRLMALGEHHPSEVSAKNRGILQMSKSELHDFAATKETDLPEHVKHATHPAKNLGAHLHPKKEDTMSPRQKAHEHTLKMLHGHARMHGMHGQHADAYVQGALNERHGMHHGGGMRSVASGHGYTGDHVQSYMQGAQNEAAGMHAEPPTGMENEPEPQMAQAEPEPEEGDEAEPA